MVNPLGRMTAALGLLAWFGGVLLGWQELLVVAATALVLLTIAALFTIGRLDLSTGFRLSNARVEVGERVAGELTVRNNRRRPARSFRIELPVGRDRAAYPIDNLPGQAETTELFIVPTHRRAVIPVGPVVSVQGDPLGLMRRVQVLSDVDEILVHPKTVPFPAIAAGLIRDMEGKATNRLSPSDVAFHTLRDYVPGDDLRHVHWKSSAKLDLLQVRQYVDTRRSHVAVLLSLDLADYASDDEFELAISCAASVALQALLEGQTLSMLAGGEHLVAHSQRALLDHFSRLEGALGSGGLDDCVKAVRRHAPEASVAVACVGSRPSVPALQAACRLLSADAVVVVFRAALDTTPGYRQVGDTTYVDLAQLRSLTNGLPAAAS